MARQQYGNLVSHGLQMAGVESALASFIKTDLNAWLSAVAREWPWPQLFKRIPLDSGGVGPVLGAGVKRLTIGNGNGNIQDFITFINSPFWVYTTDYSRRGQMIIRQLYGGTLDDDETVNNPNTQTGIPTRCKIRQSAGATTAQPTPGQWDVVPTPVADVSYNLGVDIWVDPAPVATDGSADTTLLWYPNDRTLLQVVMTEAYRYKQRMDKWKDSLTLLAKMIAEDKMRFGDLPGTNDVVGLDEAIFRSSPPSNYPRW